MSEMIERVAKNIHLNTGSKTKWDDLEELEKLQNEVLAQAAIKAMREPTKKMKVAGAKFTDGEAVADDAWGAMIESAFTGVQEDCPDCLDGGWDEGEPCEKCDGDGEI